MLDGVHDGGRECEVAKSEGCTSCIQPPFIGFCRKLRQGISTCNGTGDGDAQNGGQAGREKVIPPYAKCSVGAS